MPSNFAARNPSRGDMPTEVSISRRPSSAPLRHYLIAALLATGLGVVDALRRHHVASARDATALALDDWSRDRGRLELNDADFVELSALPGVGPVMAERLLRWRAIRGVIHDVEELRLVPGIGVRTMERLEPFVTICR